MWPPAHEGKEAPAVNETHVAVLLWYTHSHYQVGNGNATCDAGCVCAPQALTPHIRALFGTQVGVVWGWACGGGVGYGDACLSGGPIYLACLPIPGLGLSQDLNRR